MTSLKRLETFYWAARQGSFTAAANKLCATQSTVSMRIQELEREFDGQLFDRSQRTATLTELGRDLLVYAEKLLAVYAEMHERVGSPELMTGTIRIGVTEVVSLTWLPDLITRIHTDFPRVRVELEEALTLDLVTEFEEGRIDLVLAPSVPTRKNIIELELGSVPFNWMAGPTLELPQQPVTPRQMERWPVIALAPNSAHHRSVEDWFEDGNARVWRMDTCKSMNVAASLAARGLGITLLPNACFQDYLDQRQLRIVETNPPFPSVRFTAICARNAINSLAGRVAELSREVSSF